MDAAEAPHDLLPPPAAARRFAGANVLVVGDVALDRATEGRLGAQDMFVVEAETARLGGAGEVVRHLVSLGVATAFISVVGDDPAGAELTGLVGAQRNVEPWLLVQGGRTTQQIDTYVAGGRAVMRVARQDQGAVHPKIAERLVRIARDAMAATNATVLSDGAGGVLAGAVARELLDAARAAGRKSIVHPWGPALERFAGADIALLDMVQADGTADAARALRDRHGFDAVAVAADETTLLAIDARGQHAVRVAPGWRLDGSAGRGAALATLAAAIAAGADFPAALDYLGDSGF